MEEQVSGLGGLELRRCLVVLWIKIPLSLTSQNVFLAVRHRAWCVLALNNHFTHDSSPVVAIASCKPYR